MRSDGEETVENVVWGVEMFWKRYLERLQSNLLYKRAFRAKE